MATERIALDAPVTPAAVAALLEHPTALVATRRRRRRRSGQLTEFALAAPPPAAQCNPADLAPVSQQLPFNTCVANAACRLLETLNWRSSHRRVRFNAEEFHHCVKGRPLDEGVADPGQFLGAVQQLGLPVDGRYEPPQPCPVPPSTLQRLGRWSRVRDESDAKSAIAGGMPVLAMMTTTSSFAQVTDFAIWRDPPGARNLVHAVLLVGYDNPAGAWTIQNSFGLGWGVQGFGRIGYGQASILADNHNAAFAAA